MIITGRTPRVLIVDDDRANRELLEVMLAGEGFVVSLAVSGADALARVAEDPPDLILLDVMMPGMDGYQVATRIKTSSTTKHIPIIMVTALNDRSARLLGLGAGAEDFVSKPVDRAELCVRVRNLLKLKAYGDYHDKYSQLLESEVGSRTAELVDSELLYRSTFDAAPVGIVHIGLDGTWLRVNARICALLGYTKDELQSASARAQLGIDEQEAETEAFARMAAGTLDRYVVDERGYLRRDGGVVWARVNISVHRGSDGRAQHFISVIEDITEQRALDASVRQASKMDAVGRLASGVAHDFNNLLSIVLSYSELLADELPLGDPMRGDLEEIHSAGLRAVELTRQLLAFSRQQVLQPKIVDLTGVAQGMEKMLRRLLGEDVELKASYAPGLGQIRVDPGQLEQVIMNLAVNARDAMPRCGTLGLDVAEVLCDAADPPALGVMTPGRHVMLSISDTGTGIDTATQARMFEPFFTTKGAGQGTGLGLATVFGIVRQSGGAIRVESALGIGTTFRVYFPVVDAPTTADTKLRHRAERRTLRGVETILLVEDEERVRNVTRTILHKYGYTVLDAQSGGDALLLCEQHESTIHLLLTDVVMPRMSGRQLAERLLTIRPAMKVLYMSGHTDDAMLRHGVLESTIAFLQKPITPELLATKVRETLQGLPGGAPARP